MDKYTIIADENMPHIEYLFGDMAHIIRLNGRDIANRDLKYADALLCRSVTKVNEKLLKNTLVRFVGTATIGTDHLDIHWLKENKIKWTNAAGCNAAAVAQYVISGIAFWFKSNQNYLKKEFRQLSVGIIGAGHVGSQLASYLKCLGIKCYLCDPPLEKQGDKRNLVNLDKILNCDVISLHVPLTFMGEDKTFHLINEDILNALSKEQLLINSARGEIIDNKILLEYLRRPNFASVILDVFENEPNICSELLEYCLLATPHIAGHTLEGKSRGSYMVYQAFCEHFNLIKKYSEDDLYPPKNILQEKCSTELEYILELYKIQADSYDLVSVPKSNIDKHFDSLRKNYLKKDKINPRRDYSGWVLNNSFKLTQI